jgi:hypothetical protein
MWSTSYIWNTGHKIRVAISSSNYPRFLNNPNTKDPISQNNTYNIAENTIYLDSTHPSCIILPEIGQQPLNKNFNVYQFKENSKKNIINYKFDEFLQNKIKKITNNELETFCSDL